jgi:hypothetical protein
VVIYGMNLLAGQTDRLRMGALVVGVRHSGSMATPTASSAARLIAWGSSTAGVLDPSQRVNLEVEVTPTLAALSLLNSRRAFWETHALVVGFAIDMVGEADPYRVTAELDSKENIRQWFDDQDFQGYVDNQYVETEHAGLVVSATVIDSTITSDALRSAQFGTVKIEYCMRVCGDDQQCVLRCLAS